MVSLNSKLKNDRKCDRMNESVHESYCGVSNVRLPIVMEAKVWFTKPMFENESGWVCAFWMGIMRRKRMCIIIYDRAPSSYWFNLNLASTPTSACNFAQSLFYFYNTFCFCFNVWLHEWLAQKCVSSSVILHSIAYRTIYYYVHIFIYIEVIPKRQ